jgi:ketosteroid isomerase-like protein
MKGLVLTAILATAAAPAMAQDKAHSLKESIDATNQAFDAAFNRGDAAAVAAFYTPEATILPPGAPAMTGRAQI